MNFELLQINCKNCPHFKTDRRGRNGICKLQYPDEEYTYGLRIEWFTAHSRFCIQHPKIIELIKKENSQ